MGLLTKLRQRELGFGHKFLVQIIPPDVDKDELEKTAATHFKKFPVCLYLGGSLDRDEAEVYCMILLEHPYCRWPQRHFIWNWLTEHSKIFVRIHYGFYGD